MLKLNKHILTEQIFYAYYKKKKIKTSPEII